MKITVNCTHPVTGQPTYTSLEVDLLDADVNILDFPYLE